MKRKPRLRGRMWVCPRTKKIVEVEFADDGETIRRMTAGGKVVPVKSRQGYLDHGPAALRRGSFKPVVMTSVGVHASDAGALRQELREKLGYTVEVTPDGDPIVHSNPEKRRVLKALGFFDRDGYDTGGTPGQEDCR